MAPNARAGSYVGAYAVPATNPVTYTQIPYSQGTHYTPGQTGFGNYPDTLSSGSYGGSSGGGAYSDCSGAIYTSWTWVPATGQTMITDPPPSQVIIMQTCSVSVGLGQSGGSGTYDDGLGTSGSASFNPPTSTGGSGTDTHYSVQTGGATVTLSAVNAKAQVSNAPSSASVSYTASVTPVTVNITGTYGPTHYDFHVLTGQQITATLNGIPSDPPNGFKVTKYTWSIAPSATVFKTYDPTLASNQLVALGSTDLAGPASGSTTVAPLAFYDRAAENLTVTCAVTVTAPDGTTLSLTATSPQINVLKPTASWGIDPTSAPINGTSTSNIVGFIDSSGGSQYFGVNTTWYPVKIVVPAPFAGLAGKGCFAQIATPSATITRKSNGTGASSYSIKIKNAQGVWVSPGTGLDQGFPYPIGFTTDANGNWTGQASDSSWPVSGTGASGDYPKGQETVPDVDGGGTTWTSSTISDNFTTWLMYQPAGGVWIPIQSATWTVAGTATGGPSNWSATGGPIPKGGYTAPVPTNTPTPPQWSVVISGQTYHP